MTALKKRGSAAPKAEAEVAAVGWLKSQPAGVQLAVKLQPRASRDEIGEQLSDELKIKVTAPPVDSAANEALVTLLADHLGCARSRITLIRGKSSRHKTLLLQGFNAQEVADKLLKPTG
jgi:uncharacterized protein (TIGR00251 family)